MKLEAKNIDEAKEMKSFDPFSNLESSEDDEEEDQILDYAEQKPKKKGLRTECDFYEQKLKAKNQRVRTKFIKQISVLENISIPQFIFM